MAYWRTHALFDSTFGGMVMRQYWSDLALWELFLNAYPDIKTVIELGAFHGGMSLFLKAETLARGQKFWTLDRLTPNALYTPLWKKMEIDFIEGDFWKETNGALLELLHDLALKPLMLFVDGGNKPQEFAGFVPELSGGDYVSVHDYSTEFLPENADPVAHLLEPVFVEECEGPPQPCLTRFWRVR
jgi:cephalosporin hydroxylase